ncbi:sialidase-4 [Orycteropus afer afer]|uniref:exo-alpha-sialidase n=1 Tax=Orycteropus afer afer TaxID=1230840 RepID=A0A8B7A0E6_ORYAF|nr:sialidase-4 [Orycteropus afer afer]
MPAAAEHAWCSVPGSGQLGDLGLARRLPLGPRHTLHGVSPPTPQQPRLCPHTSPEPPDPDGPPDRPASPAASASCPVLHIAAPALTSAPSSSSHARTSLCGAGGLLLGPGPEVRTGLPPSFSSHLGPAAAYRVRDAEMRKVPPRTVLFERERTGLTYRVPALLPVPPGPTLLAFAEQRLSPDDSHAHRLVLRRGTLARGAPQWGGLRVLETAALEGHRSMNPCPVHEARTGTVFLFFIAVLGHTPEAVQIATGRNAARLCCVTSRDAGLTWGPARDLTVEAVGRSEQEWATFAVGPGHGVQLPSGRLLVPAYTYRVDRRECFGRICRTSPHAFVFYSDDLGGSWRHGGLVPNLRSGECQLAAVEGSPGGPVLYCNARSPLGSRVQALSDDEGASFLPGQLVPSLAETARGCQGSVVGFPAPSAHRPLARSHSHTSHSGPVVQESLEEGAQDTCGVAGGGGNVLGEPGCGPCLQGESWASVVQAPSPTWLLYSHPTGRRARLHMGVCLSMAPLDPHSWTEPWVIYEGPSGYSDLAALPGVHRGGQAFACLYESGTRVSYEEIAFSLFSLRDVLNNVPPEKEHAGCLPS